MNINERIGRIPFWVLFLVISFMVIFSFVYTYVHMDYPQTREGNPAVHFLASQSSSMFNIGYKYFFLYSIPFVLLLLYGAIKLASWLIRVVDKRTDLKGDNQAAMYLIMIMLPNVLHQIVHTVFGVLIIPDFNEEYKLTTMAGFVLLVIYVLLTEYLYRNSKKK